MLEISHQHYKYKNAISLSKLHCLIDKISKVPLMPCYILIFKTIIHEFKFPTIINCTHSLLIN